MADFNAPCLDRIELRSEYGSTHCALPEQRKVIALIQSLKAQGKGIIFISHNLGDIFEVADRIVVFRRGVNAGERKPKETTGDEIVRMMVGK